MRLRAAVPPVRAAALRCGGEYWEQLRSSAGQSDLSIVPFIAQVEPIANAPLRDGIPLGQYMKEGPGEMPNVADSTYLGGRELYYGMGLLSEEGRVCLALTVVDPESNPTVPSKSACSSYAEFTGSGLIIDMGGWELEWFADGTVSWD